jgi:hypothetical protein
MSIITEHLIQLAQRILEFTSANPTLTYDQVAAHFGCSPEFVYITHRKAGRQRPRGRKPGISPQKKEVSSDNR